MEEHSRGSRDDDRARNEDDTFLDPRPPLVECWEPGGVQKEVPSSSTLHNPSWATLDRSARGDVDETPWPMRGVDYQDDHHVHPPSPHILLLAVDDHAPGTAHARLPYDPGGGCGGCGDHPGKRATAGGPESCSH